MSSAHGATRIGGTGHARANREGSAARQMGRRPRGGASQQESCTPARRRLRLLFGRTMRPRSRLDSATAVGPPTLGRLACAHDARAARSRDKRFVGGAVGPWRRHANPTLTLPGRAHGAVRLHGGRAHGLHAGQRADQAGAAPRVPGRACVRAWAHGGPTAGRSLLGMEAVVLTLGAGNVRAHALCIQRAGRCPQTSARSVDERAVRAVVGRPSTAQALLLPWCLAHFWSAHEGSWARAHVRVFLTLRCISWALGERASLPRAERTHAPRGKVRRAAAARVRCRRRCMAL